MTFRIFINKYLIMKHIIRRILRESVGGINRDDITLNDIWYGFETFKHGYTQSISNSPLKQIQKKLKEKNPNFARKIGFKPDSDFGDKTSKMVGNLFGKVIKDPKSVEIGPITLEKLGFKKPTTLSLDAKILAVTMSTEMESNKPEEIQAIANVIANRSIAKGVSVVDIVLESSQFSGWNKYQPVERTDENIDRIIKKERTMNTPSWDTSVEYSEKLLSGANFPDNSNGSTHYFYAPKGSDLYNNPKAWMPPKNNKWVDKGVKGLSHTYGVDGTVNWARKFKGR